MTTITYDLQTEAGHSWVEAGSGAPLVLVHGIGGTTDNWSPVLEALAQRYHVLAWSFPGYNGARALTSPRPEAEDYADRLADFLRRRGIGPARVVGHSLGAVVVAALAGSCRELVSRLDLICPVVGAGNLPEAARAATQAARADEIRSGGMQQFAEARTESIVGPTAEDQDLRQIIATMAEIPAESYLQAWHMLCAADLLRLLVPGVLPVQVIGGDLDPVAPPDAVQSVAERLGVSPIILPGIGHFPTYEARDVLVDLLTAGL
ncbi:hypothetical protein CVM52_04305 [Pseudooceanicola lipolyticus]|uniref:AB hydrolase-1 domain-containing protein n=1 Tax=Pseudooceanicola lipolyticus TaxID=2029104 RepID=A0A2M8J5F4_9RHOB|nr:alpha/beta fold hydrolase [Pseudooceanicola lipolyticus]PJE38003.1 hypothetical protein CVM52_04305 [Pseudooceanicola lipolyticus]